MTLPSIRHIAICVFRHGPRILVARGFDDAEREYFLRPFGGAVEFGERAVEAVRREIREELCAEIEEPMQLGSLENLFTYRSRPGHEIVFVFDARFEDSTLYTQESIPIREAVWVGPAHWLDLGEPTPAPLYPEGLVKLLGTPVQKR